MSRLAVVGAGAAGTAAAWHIARRGVDVTVLHAGAGASALYSGALDVDPFDEAPRGSQIDAAVLSFATAFEAWSVGAAAARVVTDAGVVRPAQGLDVALLDLEPLRGKRIAVADVPEAGFDGRLLAQAASAAPWSIETGTEFVSTSVEPPGIERHPAIPAYDQARALDDDAVAEAFADHLRARSEGSAAWLVGPWLGTTAAVADLVRTRLGMPCGEVTSPPGGPAGARFERARDEMFESLGIRERRGPVRAARPLEGRWELLGPDEALGIFDGVVLAIGGLVGGGIVLADARPGERARFGLSLDAPVALALDGHVVDAASSLHGVDLQREGILCLEKIGVHCLETRAVGASGLWVAGDALAGRPRTALRAAATGLLAARAALQ